MELKGLISLIVPCYNISGICDKFFESLLNQTYKNFEVICINDGSKDNTEEILLEYKKRFDDEGISFKYIYQENKGVGGAINTGLKAFTGDFLCWADSDDYFTNDSFEIKLRALLENPDYDVVIGDSYYGNIDEPINENKLLSKKFDCIRDENQFYHLINGKSMLCSGCYMVRVSSFDKVNPNREIYEDRKGQNIQMLMPLYFSGKVLYLDKPVYFYSTYNVNSVSHTFKDMTKIEEEKDRQYTVFKNTVDNMLISVSDNKKIMKAINIYLNNNILSQSISSKNKTVFKKYLRCAIVGRFINIKTLKILIRYLVKQ